jgi:eukaryotic-like serine/threonine-protein kinase
MSMPAVDEGAGTSLPAELLRGTAYRPLRCLGKGAMGAVWECEHLGLRKRVAVKLLHLETAGEAGSPAAARADRLRLEAQATAQIHSPHVVEVTDFGTSPDGQLYLVMERLVGRTLEEEVKERGPLPVEEAVAIVVQMLRGLEAAHEVGVVHRDVKPSNVFYTAADREGRRLAKLVDFGLVRVESDEAGLSPLAVPTLAGSVMGTPRYISPEQARGNKAEPRSDLYSAALVLYKLVTGRGPFDEHATSCELMLLAHAALEPPPPSSFAPSPLSPEFDAVVLRALAKEPASRHASAAAFAQALLDAPLRASVRRGPGPALPLLTEIMPESSEAERALLTEPSSEAQTEAIEPRAADPVSAAETPTLPAAGRSALSGLAPTLDSSGSSEAATARMAKAHAPTPARTLQSPVAAPAPMPWVPSPVAAPVPPEPAPKHRTVGELVAVVGIGLTVLAVAILAIVISLHGC